MLLDFFLASQSLLQEVLPSAQVVCWTPLYWSWVHLLPSQCALWLWHLKRQSLAILLHRTGNAKVIISMPDRNLITHINTCSWAKCLALLFRTQSEVLENMHRTGQGGEVITSFTREKWRVQQPPHVIGFYLGSQHATLYQHPHKERQEVICPQCYTPLVRRFHLSEETNNETMRGRNEDYPNYT